MGILFTILIGFLLTITMGIPFTIVLGIQFTISKCVRIEGDHYVYIKQGIMKPVVIPDWPEVPVFIIKNNMRTAGMSRKEDDTRVNKVFDFTNYYRSLITFY